MILNSDCRSIIDVDTNIPIVVATGLESDQISHQLKELGVQESFLKEVFEFNRLGIAVKSAINSHSATRYFLG